MPSKAAVLRRALAAPVPIVLAGAHDALSARLVEEAAFDGVWASGFELSCSRGVPDASLLTMTDMLEAAREMNEAVAVPVVADCDSGFGNAINTIHMMRAYESAGIAAVCIEDSVFPKRCSFYANTVRELTPVEEQALKIRAACEARRAGDTVVIARTEALIAGHGVDAALERAHAYVAAGADALLVHSNRRTSEEVVTFARHWDGGVPLVAVPTTYPDSTVDDLHTAGYQVVIFANHGVRAAIHAMRATLRELRLNGGARAVDDRIATLADVFDLVRVDEMQADERRYLTNRLTTVP